MFHVSRVCCVVVGVTGEESCFPVERWCVDTLSASPGSELLTISRLLIDLFIYSFSPFPCPGGYTHSLPGALAFCMAYA